MQQVRGLYAAVFTPFDGDGGLNLARVPAVVEHLVKDSVDGLFVCGTTGEWSSLTFEERKSAAEAYVQSAEGRLPVIIQVGDNSLPQAKELARHARAIGADGMALLPPFYLKPPSDEGLVQWCHEIASAAQELPCYFYHIPSLTGVRPSLPDFLEKLAKALPNFAGMKYSETDLFEFGNCINWSKKRFSLMFGVDEMLLGALAVGAISAVGSTYNFATPIYKRLWQALNRGDLESARSLQSLSVELVGLCNRFGGGSAFKAVMGLVGVDCGPVRPPLSPLSDSDLRRLEEGLRKIGFFDCL